MSLEDNYDQAIDRWHAAENKIAAVLALHSPVRRYTSGSTDPKHIPSFESLCNECNQVWPCRTRATLDGPTTQDVGTP